MKSLAMRLPKIVGPFLEVVVVGIELFWGPRWAPLVLSFTPAAICTRSFKTRGLAAVGGFTLESS